MVAPNSPGKKGTEQKKKNKNKIKKQKIGGGTSPPPASQVSDIDTSPSKGKGGVPDPTYCEPLRAWPRLRSGEPSKYPRMGDAVALVSPRIKGGLIRPLGSGEGYSALRSQTPKSMKTWARGITPSPVRKEGT